MSDPKTIVAAIREHQVSLRDIAYERFKEYILTYVTKESAIEHTKKVVMHLDASEDYLKDALFDVMRDIEESYAFATHVERISCGQHDLMHVTIYVD